MSDIIIQNQSMAVKEYLGQRVVTFADVERVHNRPKGTCKRNFNSNKDKFILGTDFYEVSREDVGTNFVPTYGFSEKAPKGVLLTETGYLMLVKSFTDDLSWAVQRELVNAYFRGKETIITQTDEMRVRSLEVRERNARARQAQILAKLADKTANDTFREALVANAANTVLGEYFLPLPKLADRTYTAEEIGNELGITANMVGRLANKHGLKTKEYGDWFADQKKNAYGEAQTFRYYRTVVDKLREILTEVVA